jgi:type IV pilus assembly protein PilV
MGEMMKSNHNPTDRLNPVAAGYLREDGFTMIEVLIALTIFTVGLLAVAKMQVSAIHVNSRANRLTQRTTYAQGKIEELVARPYTHSDLDSAVSHMETTTDGFTVSWTITDNYPAPNVKLISVTVTGYGQETMISRAKADL